MTGDPLVSIVLPTYNGARYLDQAVQSCLSQTYSNWELIIVDDASTDNTPVRIAQYVTKDGRIRSMRHETNRKLPGSLNTGFSQAKGEYFTWTSDDNFYRPPALAEMLSFLEFTPEADVVYTDYSVIDEMGHLMGQVEARDRDMLLQGNPVGPCFLYRRRVLEKIGSYSEDLYLAEDYDFWLRVSRWFQMQTLHKDLYVYRIHSDSLTINYKERIKLVTEQTLARNLRGLNWASATLRGRAYLRLADQARTRHDMWWAFIYSLHAMCYSPKASVGFLVEYLFGRKYADKLRATYVGCRSFLKSR